MIMMEIGEPLSILAREPRLLGGLLVAMALALATVATSSLVRRDRARLGPTSRRLCRALRIAPRRRRLLERVARRAGAPGAGSLLVSRGLFDHAAARYAAQPAVARELAAIRRQVFG